LSDRKVFISALNDVRVILNDIMHFDPDPPDIKPLDAFLDWLRLQGSACLRSPQCCAGLAVDGRSSWRAAE
jgi:hypothetical protein